MIRNVFKFAIVFLAVLLAACRTPAPVNNVTAEPLVPAPASLADVQKVITRAGVGQGWQMLPAGPGKIQGTLLIRDHKAVVDITYDLKTFNIKYKDSTNLGYDGTNIHPNYNVWIESLTRAIRSQMTLQ